MPEVWGGGERSAVSSEQLAVGSQAEAPEEETRVAVRRETENGKWKMESANERENHPVTEAVSPPW